MKKVLYSLLVLLTSWQVNYAQVDSGNLETYLNAYIANLPAPNGNNYVIPNNNQLNDWKLTVSHILNQNINVARNIANTFNYRIVEYTDLVNLPGEIYYVLEEKSPRVNHWGLYVFSADPCRADLNLQAPHPKKDHNTGKQAIYCFTRLNAQSLAISGTHRCNHNGASTCSGKSKVCTGVSAPFRISDLAHNTNTAFQKTVGELMAHNAQSVFVQLHGFTKKVSDPYVIMSNGTNQVPVTDYASQIKDELFIADNTLTFKLPHIDIGWIRLAGFTNTQGRLVNGSNNPCNQSAANANGRFVHIEQEKLKLRANANGWNKMYLALSNVFACNMGNNARKTQETHIPFKIYPNPSKQQVLTVIGSQISQVTVTNINGVVVFNKSYNHRSKIQLDPTKLPKGMYFIIVKGKHQQYTQKLFLK